MQAVRLARYHTRRSHLVRFCGAYHGWWEDVQPGPGNPAASARNLHARGNERAHAEGAAHASRHRLRARESAPGADPHFGRDRRFLAGRQRSPRVVRSRGLHGLAEAAARGLHGARHRADLRRDLRRLSPGAGRRAAVLRGAGRHGDLRQDAGRRPAGRRRVRPERADEALPRGSPGRHLLRPRHVQFSPLRDGRDERVPDAPAASGDPGPLRRPRRALERPRRAPEHAAARGGRAGARRQSLVDLDGALHAAVALQLDAAVLPACARPRAELGRHRALHLQPRLRRRRLRGGARALPSPRRAPGCAIDGWWWDDPSQSNRSIRRGILREMVHQRLSRKAAE